jgi:uncharacterized metal-binding protein
LFATTVGLISCLQPIYGSILAIVLLNERPNLVTIIVGLLVSSAAAFETYSISKIMIITLVLTDLAAIKFSHGHVVNLIYYKRSKLTLSKFASSKLKNRVNKILNR